MDPFIIKISFSKNLLHSHLFWPLDQHCLFIDCHLLRCTTTWPQTLRSFARSKLRSLCSDLTTLNSIEGLEGRLFPPNLVLHPYTIKHVKAIIHVIIAASMKSSVERIVKSFVCCRYQNHVNSDNWTKTMR